MTAALDAVLDAAPVAAGPQACVFTLADRVLALDVSAVREIVIVDELTAVPLAPAHVLGIANLRGAVVPVADPRPALGLPTRPGGRRLRALVLAADGCEVALVVDDVLGLETLEPAAEAPDPAAVPAGLASGAVAWRGRPVTVLDAAALVAALRPIRPS